VSPSWSRRRATAPVRDEPPAEEEPAGDPQTGLEDGSASAAEARGSLRLLWIVLGMIALATAFALTAILNHG